MKINVSSNHFIICFIQFNWRELRNLHFRHAVSVTFRCVIVMATVNSAHCSNVMMIICDKNTCLNVPPPTSTVSIFCECAEHKNSEFYSFYINIQWWCVSKWNIMHFTLLLSEHFMYKKSLNTLHTVVNKWKMIPIQFFQL